MTLKRPSSQQRGIALISVLWVITLLTLLATNLSLTSRSQGQQSQNIIGSVQARLAAEAGIQLALLNLNMAAEQRPWLTDGGGYHFQLEDSQVWVATFSESGRIDLNGADQELLAGLLRAARVEDSLNAELVDAILDWRDEDELRRLNGAEYEDYLAAGREEGPANAPFETVEELQQVLGMTPEIYRRIRHSLTLYNPRNGIAPQFAPRQVLLALPNTDAALVDQYIEERRRNHQNGQPPPSADMFPRRFLSDGGANVYYTIHTEARLNTGSRYRLTATLIWRRNRFVMEQISQEQIALFTGPDS